MKFPGRCVPRKTDGDKQAEKGFLKELVEAVGQEAYMIAAVFDIAKK